MPFGYFEEDDEVTYTGDRQHVKKRRDYSLEEMYCGNGPETVTKKREDTNNETQF